MKNIISKLDDVLMYAYKRYQIVLDYGKGVYLYDVNGKKYLDFGAGIAVCALGYNNEEFNDALKNTIDKAIHFSNYFYSKPMLEAATKLTKAAKMDKIFFANSGSEANEGAIKLAKKYAKMNGHENRHKIISMEKSFHGRSAGALSVTGNKKYRECFEPMLPDVHFATYNDLESVKKLVDDDTYAIILEPVQGEGGIYKADKEFIEGVRKLCDEHDIIMICDEVQCGMGRTGKMFAYENYEIKPDIITMAKGIGNGVVVGAFAAVEKVGKCLVPGDHGTTFGGNPLATTAVSKCLDLFEKNSILDNVNTVGAYLNEKLQELVDKKDVCAACRGIGLMQALELKVEARQYIDKALDNGLILMAAGANTIRFVPPLVISKENVDEMIAILDAIL